MLRTRGRWAWLVGLAACAACGGGAEPPEEEMTSPDEPVAASTSINDRFAGTWELVTVERFDENDQLLPPADPPGFGREGTTGYITYDRAGYMGVVIMMPDRLPYSVDVPTADEASRSMSGYISYFGPYSVNEAEGSVTHHLLASRSPNGAGNDNLRAYEFHDDQLTLRPPRGESGVQLALTWQRVPDAALTPEQQQFVGFWQIQSVERRNAAGEPQDTRQWANEYIIYTPRLGTCRCISSDPTERATKARRRATRRWWRPSGATPAISGRSAWTRRSSSSHTSGLAPPRRVMVRRCHSSATTSFATIS